MAQQQKKQTFNLEFKSNGLKEIITDSRLLKDSIPEITKKSNAQIEVMNALFKDSNNFMKALGRETLFTEGRFTQLKDVASTTIKMQSIATSVFDKNLKSLIKQADAIEKQNKSLRNNGDILKENNKKSEEALDLEIQKANERRKAELEGLRNSKRFEYFLSRIVDQIPVVSEFEDAVSTKGGLGNINKTYEFTSNFDESKKNKFYLEYQIEEYNAQRRGEIAELITQLKDEGKEREAQYHTIRRDGIEKLEENESNRRRREREIDNEYTGAGSIAINQREKLKESSNLGHDIKIKEIIRDTLAEYVQYGLDELEELHSTKEVVVEAPYIPQKEKTNSSGSKVNKNIEVDKDDKELQLRQQREQSNLQLDEQAFFHERSLLETESFNDRQNELLDEAQQSMSNFVQANQEAGDAIVETAADTQESHKEHWSKISATMQEHVDIIMTGVNAIFSASNALLSEQLEEANEKFEAISEKYSEAVELRQESSDKISSLEEQAKNARGGRLLILQEQINQEMAKNQQLAQQEKQLAKEKEKAEKEKEKKEKQIKKNEISQGIIQGVANTALGVTKAWSLGPIIGPIMAAIVGAAGAIQVGVMTKQLSKLEDGGFLKGKRHSQGGMRIEGTNIEVEGGEYVINRESTSKNLGLVRYINSQRKELNATDMTGFFAKASQGFELPFQREFAAGGLMPAIETPSTIDNEALIDAIKSIKINSRVAVTDIIRAQEDAVQVDRWSGN